jgi:hypothetical protein
MVKLLGDQDSLMELGGLLLAWTGRFMELVKRNGMVVLADCWIRRHPCWWVVVPDYDCKLVHNSVRTARLPKVLKQNCSNQGNLL